MKWILVLASVVTAFSAFSTAPVMADDVSDVVRARANARAGGGTSGHDAYILKQSGGALSGSKSNAYAKKKAAAKRRALKAAKRKAAAKRRAAKKKAAAKQRAAIAARKAKQKRAAARKATAKASDTEKSEDTTSAPSTAAVLTNQDVGDDRTDSATKDEPSEVVAANDDDKDNGKTVETPEVDNSTVKEDGAEGGCKRFIPEVGQTVSVDC